MKKTIRKNFAFLLPYLLFLVVAGIFGALYSKGEAHLIINQYRAEFFDHFFFLATYLGDGYTVVIIIMLLCFIRYRHAILIAASNILAALVTQTLKHTIFADQVRPKKYFEGITELKLIPWVENYSYNSFPSGHTTAAFATFFCLALVLENRLLKFLMFCIALLIGFSRVYLSQHFLNDVCAGSVIGVVTSLLIYQYVFLLERIKNAVWMKNSILKNHGSSKKEEGV
ncbi:MAG: phosphatase PAP2 family protein [Bacteroidetes bacterium]|nr:MAG: phosphatase PAP2 family protein [Bacteroidota bacterium]